MNSPTETKRSPADFVREIEASGGPSFDGDSIPAERFTCFTCSAKFNCREAYDPYNLDGDCLAEK